MKALVINPVAGVGKSIIAQFLLAARLPGARLVAIDLAGIQGNPAQIGELKQQLHDSGSLIVDLGGSLAMAFLEAFAASLHEFDVVCVPVSPASLSDRGALEASLARLSTLGIPLEKVRVIFNMVEPGTRVEQVFSDLFDYERATGHCTILPGAVIHRSEVFELLEQEGLTLAQVLADKTDLVAQLSRAEASAADPGRTGHLLTIRQLAHAADSEFDQVFRTLMAGVPGAQEAASPPPLSVIDAQVVPFHRPDPGAQDDFETSESAAAEPEIERAAEVNSGESTALVAEPESGNIIPAPDPVVDPVVDLDPVLSQDTTLLSVPGMPAEPVVAQVTDQIASQVETARHHSADPVELLEADDTLHVIDYDDWPVRDTPLPPEWLYEDLNDGADYGMPGTNEPDCFAAAAAAGCASPAQESAVLVEAGALAVSSESVPSSGPSGPVGENFDVVLAEVVGAIHQGVSRLEDTVKGLNSSLPNFVNEVNESFESLFGSISKAAKDLSLAAEVQMSQIRDYSENERDQSIQAVDARAHYVLSLYAEHIEKVFAKSGDSAHTRAVQTAQLLEHHSNMVADLLERRVAQAAELVGLKVPDLASMLDARVEHYKRVDIKVGVSLDAMDTAAASAARSAAAIEAVTRWGAKGLVAVGVGLLLASAAGGWIAHAVSEPSNAVISANSALLDSGKLLATAWPRLDPETRAKINEAAKGR